MDILIPTKIQPISVEYTVGVGIYTIALSLAGGIAAGIGEVVQEAIGVIGVFA